MLSSAFEVEGIPAVAHVSDAGWGEAFDKCRPLAHRRRELDRLFQRRFPGGRLFRPRLAGATRGALAPNAGATGISMSRVKEGDGRGAHRQAERLRRSRKVHDVT